MIDSHCHIDLAAFDHDREKVINSCLSLGVERILVPGLGLQQVDTILALKNTFPCLDIAAGFHPYFLQKYVPNLDIAGWHKSCQAMHDWLTEHAHDIVAIGEFGLDGSLSVDMRFQQRVFLDQVELAKVFKKPLVLHHRQSHNELIRLLKQSQFTKGGVIHAFSGSEQIAKTYVDMGFALGVGGTITYPRGKKTREALKHINTRALLLETDAPDMPLCGYQGQRNTPERLPLVAAALAELKDCSIEEIARVSSDNYKALFSLDSAK